MFSGWGGARVFGECATAAAGDNFVFLDLKKISYFSKVLGDPLSTLLRGPCTVHFKLTGSMDNID